VDEILKICEGLPLSLKVLGGLFLGQPVVYWKRQLEKICTTLPYDIINPFKVCYEALGPVEKQLFLDIGCFLVGEEQELAIQVLEGLYENNRIGDYLEGLLQKCLVDVHRDGYGSVKITMHSQLRELARHIGKSFVCSQRLPHYAFLAQMMLTNCCEQGNHRKDQEQTSGYGEFDSPKVFHE
jgi:hypothetical protein